MTPLRANIILLTCILLTASGSAEEPFRPPFAWDTIPLYAHFGHSSGLSDEQVSFLASHYKFIVFEKNHGRDRYGYTEYGTLIDVARVKEIAPDATVLYYWNLLLDYPFYQSLITRPDNDKWFIHGLDGELDLKRSHLKRYDLSNPDWQKWWVDEAVRMVAEGNMDGVFIDALPQIALKPKANISKWGLGKYIAVESAISETLKDLKHVLGEDKLVIINGIRSVPNGWGHGGLKYLDHADGVIVEHFNAFMSKAPAQLEQDIKRMSQATKAGKVVIFKAFPGFTWLEKDMMSKSYEELAALSRERITFPLAAYLIVAGRWSYFNYTWGYQGKHGPFEWYPEYDRALGRPMSDAIKSGPEYRREFEFVSVYLNIETKQARLVWR
ncbi:MAG: hypothetical protein HN621_07745 [Porticoccaceae bacterium]|nr:hypothetical protein [Porticoccaceae bacterium]